MSRLMFCPGRHRQGRPRIRHLLAAAALSTVSVIANAQQIAPAAPADVLIGVPAAVPLAQIPETFMTRSTMTGDWGGLRTQLHESGSDFAAAYVNEYAGSFSGGERIGSDFAQQLAFGAVVNLEKVIGLAGGTFAVTFNAREGRSTSADFIGNSSRCRRSTVPARTFDWESSATRRIWPTNC